MKGLLRTIWGRYPLIFLGLPGLVALGAGVLWGAWVVYRTLSGSGLAIGSAVASASLCLAGLVVLCTGITLYTVRLLIEDAG